MQKIPLYRYIRADGGVTVSTEKPDAEYTELTRLVADEGYALTNGEITTPCTDTDTPGAWTEVVDTDADYPDPNEATEADYQSALRDMGVEI